ncbi:hypothetical protein A1507_18620 [Methylomonas koyamae]|uniref:SIS domain-containing protein n=2 Tax=Methylomonas koyamae TaxID=702114 RepID=A0A177N5B5_9GAMM|nr:hypothetical protein A1507_18620 [Methylomonas koyamae]
MYMGKPFAREINDIPESVTWGLKQDIEILKRILHGNSNRHLTAIGSGGSLTAAAFLAKLHELSGSVANALTPLEYISKPNRQQRNKTVAFLSAEGKNKDIIAAAQASLNSSYLSFSLTFSKNNPLAELCDTTGLATVIAYDMPWGKDGYLATNSLIAMMVLIARAYDENFKLQLDCEWIENRRNELREQNVLQQFYNSRPIIILYGQLGRIAALDLESKLAESAFAVSELCDYRQFAHGRHLQFTSPKTPLVVAFTSLQDKRLSEMTLSLLPHHVPILKVDLPEDPVLAEIIGTIDAMLVTEILADIQDIDPGQPYVPKFGSEIYGLDIRELLPQKKQNDNPAVEFKFRCTDKNYVHHGIEFLRQLEAARFKAIVCDFDGTFCDTARRYEGLDEKLVPEVERLLSGGITLGFATGRGDSLYNDLRKKLNPLFWHKVPLGLYSGSYILSLDTENLTFPPEDSRFQELLSWLDTIGLLHRLEAKPKIMSNQMGIRITGHSDYLQTLAAIRYWITDTGKIGWRAYCSGHSIDVITENAGKAVVVQAVAEQTDSDPRHEILRIGDSGDFDGNDFELLNDGLSLSVGPVSPRPGSCWNLLPKEFHGHIGTLYYLSSLDMVDGRAVFSKHFIEKAKTLIG